MATADLLRNFDRFQNYILSKLWTYIPYINRKNITYFDVALGGFLLIYLQFRGYSP